MAVIALDCPKCGATLPPREVANKDISCDYCGTSFGPQSVRSARNEEGVSIDGAAIAKLIAQHSARAPVQIHVGKAATQASGGCGRFIGCLFTLIALVGAGLPLLSFTGLPDFVPGVSELMNKVSIERRGWDDVGGPPVPAKVKGKRAVLGRTRYYDQDHALYIEATRAKNAERLWRFGPLGSYSDAYRSTFFAVLGKRVVITDNDAKVHLVNLDTGKKIKTRELTDKALRLCVPPNKKGKKVWIAVADERHQVLDIKSGKLKETSLPEFCPSSRFHSTLDGRRQKKLSLSKFGNKKGFKVVAVHIEKKEGVAAVNKHPGTALPQAVGFDPKTKKIRWKKGLAVSDKSSVRQTNIHNALVDGRYVAIYGTGQDTWYITALDAKTGDRIWNTKLRPLFAVDSIDGIVVTKRHAFVVRTSSMEIFDVRKGKLLGTVGSETYD